MKIFQNNGNFTQKSQKLFPPRTRISESGAPRIELCVQWIFFCFVTFENLFKQQLWLMMASHRYTCSSTCSLDRLRKLVVVLNPPIPERCNRAVKHHTCLKRKYTARGQTPPADSRPVAFRPVSIAHRTPLCPHSVISAYSWIYQCISCVVSRRICFHFSSRRNNWVFICKWNSTVTGSSRNGGTVSWSCCHVIKNWMVTRSSITFTFQW